MKSKSSFLVLIFIYLNFLGFTQNVQRVISLTPSITENIYLLEAENKLVGCTNYCKLAVSDGKEIVGSTIDVNLEKILSLKPDLVLTMELKKPQDIAAMKKLGINVVVYKSPKSFDGICEQTLQIAELIGVDQRGVSVVESAKKRVSSIVERMKSSEKKKMFFQIGASPIFTVLENTFMNDFITFCNGENIAQGLTRGTITREAVLVKNPDVIMIATMGGYGNDELKTWNSYEGMSAVKSGNVFLVDSETSCSPTPENFAEALTQIYQNLKE
ncbi:MAG: helical backbone metal receptor [Draconibacterium sp.]|nr:helical backbone metal receptor [Draconibacterium sp.]